MPSILPRLTLSEALDITRIYSVGDLLQNSGSGLPLIRQRPFRAPHHTISHAGLVGRGQRPPPGEISLAHRGLLFLDELPEFDPRTLEVLRQPLEDHVVTIARAQGSLTFPANFMLVAALNPCPCGYYGHPTIECTCSSALIARYQHRISGPLLDRIDIHVQVPPVDFDKLTDERQGEPSRTIRIRVETARQRQTTRFQGHPHVACNADMGVAEVREFCAVDSSGRTLLKAAMRQLQLSARAYHRILKLARTVADLAASQRIETVRPCRLRRRRLYCGASRSRSTGRNDRHTNQRVAGHAVETVIRCQGLARTGRRRRLISGIDAHTASGTTRDGNGADDFSRQRPRSD